MVNWVIKKLFRWCHECYRWLFIPNFKLGNFGKGECRFIRTDEIDGTVEYQLLWTDWLKTPDGVQFCGSPFGTEYLILFNLGRAWCFKRFMDMSLAEVERLRLTM